MKITKKFFKENFPKIKKDSYKKDMRKSFNKQISHFLNRMNAHKSSEKLDSLKKENNIAIKVIHYGKKYKSNNNINTKNERNNIIKYIKIPINKIIFI